MGKLDWDAQSERRGGSREGECMSGADLEMAKALVLS